MEGDSTSVFGTATTLGMGTGGSVEVIFGTTGAVLCWGTGGLTSVLLGANAVDSVK